MGAGRTDKDISPDLLEVSHYRRVATIFAVVCLPMLVLFAARAALDGRLLAAALVGAMAAGYAVAWAGVRKAGEPLSLVRMFRWFGRMFALLFAVYLVHALGVEGLPSRLPWIYLFPAVVCFTLSVTEAVIWIVALTALIAGVIAAADIGQVVGTSILLRIGISFALTAMVTVVGCLMSGENRTRVRRTLTQLGESRKTVDSRVRERTHGLAQMNEQLNREMDSRRRLERELRRSEERFRTIFESAPDAIYLYTLTGKFVDGNRAAEELIGGRREDLVGKSLLQLELLPASEMPRASSALLSSSLGRSTGPDEFRVRRLDGTMLDVEITTHPTRIDGQRMVLGVARDVTRQRRSTSEIRQLPERGQRIRGLTDGALQHTTEELGLALARIVSSAERLAGGDLGQVSDDQRRCLDEALEVAQEMRTSIESLASLSDDGSTTDDDISVAEWSGEPPGSPREST